MKIGFIGLGLIGGSIAKAIHKYHIDASIIAYDIDAASLALAKREGVLSEVCSDIDERFHDCSYIFLCAPVLKNDENLKKLLPFLSDNCIITDVGSVKGNIHNTLMALHFKGLFIGGHPMTGSEKSDYANSSERLLENAYYILTPEENVPASAVSDFQEFISGLNALPIVLDVSMHDTITAAISHLPHILAASLVHFIIKQDGAEQYMKILAAGGFKDMTRIASSNVSMWEDICLTNGEKISMMLSDYIKELNKVQTLLAAKNRTRLGTFFQEAKNYRDSMSDKAHGSLQRSFALYCDIPDETGVIAKLAALLAENQINIKNIGIINNREFEEGVLRVEFYDLTAFKQALTTLSAHGYSVIERN